MGMECLLDFQQDVGRDIVFGTLGINQQQVNAAIRKLVVVDDSHSARYPMITGLLANILRLPTNLPTIKLLSAVPKLAEVRVILSTRQKSSNSDQGIPARFSLNHPLTPPPPGYPHFVRLVPSGCMITIPDEQRASTSQHPPSLF